MKCPVLNVTLILKHVSASCAAGHTHGPVISNPFASHNKHTT